MKLSRQTLLKAAGAVLGLIVLVIGVAYLSGAFRQKVEPGIVEAGVETLGDEATDIIHEIIETEMTEVTGTLRATRRTQISSKLLATILEIPVKAGDRVAEGDVLVRLDNREPRARLEQARQAIAAADADLARAEAEYERFKGLVEGEIVSRQEFEQKEAAYKVALAQVEQAREAANEAGSLLADTTIKAPTEGIIVDKLAEAGDTATPGRPILNLYDPSAFRLEAAVPEALASGVEVGDRMEVKLDVLEASLEGTVEEIVPQAETASRSVLVKVAVPKQERMVEGMFGRLMIPSAERVRYCAPESSIREAGQLRFIDVVGEANRIERRQVTLGDHREYGRVEVLSGVEPGERVILHGPPPPPFPVEGVSIKRSDLP